MRYSYAIKQNSLSSCFYSPIIHFCNWKHASSPLTFLHLYAEKKSLLQNTIFLPYFQWRDELSAPNSLFLEQSYDATHLLQQVNLQKELEDVSVVHCTLLTTDNWKHTNRKYFNCLAMMQQLRQVSLKFNKDLGLEEVSSSLLFLVCGYNWWRRINFAFMLWATYRLTGPHPLWIICWLSCLNKGILLTNYLISWTSFRMLFSY